MSTIKYYVTIFVVSFSIILAPLNVIGCDICGCSVGGSYFGILPQFQKNFIGARYQLRSFTSEHLTLFPGETPLKTQETFQTAEVWGRYAVHPKIHLFAFIPYNYFTKYEADTRANISGIGDISAMVHYIVFNNGDSIDHVWKQAFQVGTGIKLPTGKSDFIHEYSGLLIPNLQAGTGAFDIPISAIYTLRNGKWGVNAEANYRINFNNKRGYQFGDRFSSSIRTFYWYGNSAFTLLPHVSAGFEYGFIDKDRGVEAEYSKSQSVLAGVGFDLYFNRLIVNANTQIPLYQHIAKGHIVGDPRLNLGLAIRL